MSRLISFSSPRGTRCYATETSRTRRACAYVCVCVCANHLHSPRRSLCPAALSGCASWRGGSWSSGNWKRRWLISKWQADPERYVTVFRGKTIEMKSWWWLQCIPRDLWPCFPIHKFNLVGGVGKTSSAILLYIHILVSGVYLIWVFCCGNSHLIFSISMEPSKCIKYQQVLSSYLTTKITD